MKKIFFFLFLSPALYPAKAQDRIPSPKIAVKWSPGSVFLGNVGLQAEYNFGKNSLTANLGIPVNKNHTFKYDDKDAVFSMKAITFLAGYRTYLSKKHMKGLYLEPFFKYVHHMSEGLGTAFMHNETVLMNFTNDYNGIGLGAQFGLQFLVKKKIVIDLFFLGPEINSSRNNFKAVEATNALPWNYSDTHEAETDIRDFIDKFPFIKHRVNLTVDQQNKTVKANFRGVLPGVRTGLSIGFAF